MPYVTSDERYILEALIIEMRSWVGPETKSGRLNYLITQMLLLTKPQDYEAFNKLVGVLACCQSEFYRRAVAIYEDTKIKDNGDVYNI